MEAATVPEYHIEVAFGPNHHRPRGFSDIAKVMEASSEQLLRAVMRPPGGLAFLVEEDDDYSPSPAQVSVKRKVRFRHGAEPKHFPIAEFDEAE